MSLCPGSFNESSSNLAFFLSISIIFLYVLNVVSNLCVVLLILYENSKNNVIVSISIFFSFKRSPFTRGSSIGFKSSSIEVTLLSNSGLSSLDRSVVSISVKTLAKKFFTLLNMSI